MVVCDPKSLLSASRCLPCLTPVQRRTVQPYLLCKISNAGLIDPVVLAWVANVIANGGLLPSQLTQLALSGFVRAIRPCGVENQLIGACMFVPDSLIAATTPLYNTGGGFNPWFNFGFLSSDLTLAGLTGDGIGKSLDTGITPQNVFASIADGGITLYVSIGNANNTTEIECNASAGATRELGLAVDAVQQANFFSWNQTTGKVVVNNPNFSGYISGNRIALNNSAIYVASSTQAHTVLGSINTSGGSLPTQAVTFGVFCENSLLGTRNSFSTRTMSFAAIHHGLTQPQSQCFFNAIQNCRMALGGGFV